MNNAINASHLSRYTLRIDGDTMTMDTLDEFFRVNEECLTNQERGEMLSLQPGFSVRGGGGAQPEWRLTHNTNHHAALVRP